MVKKYTGDIEDKIVKDHFDNLNDEFLQNVISLSAAPTAGEPLIDDNEIGVYSNNLYVRKGNTIYRFDSDIQITVT